MFTVASYLVLASSVLCCLAGYRWQRRPCLRLLLLSLACVIVLSAMLGMHVSNLVAEPRVTRITTIFLTIFTSIVWGWAASRTIQAIAPAVREGRSLSSSRAHPVA